MLSGAKGLGKTEFAKAFAKNLVDNDGDKRAFLELNCSTIKNNEQFFEQIFLPLIADNEITILFDECHALPQDLTMAFLTIFNAEKNGLSGQPVQKPGGLGGTTSPNEEDAFSLN